MVTEAVQRAEAGHVVQFYRDDTFLCEQVAEFVGVGLVRDEPVVLIATAGHLAQLRERLSDLSMDLAHAEARRRLVLFDAEELLARIMVGDAPDEDRFQRLIGGELARAAASGQRVRASGEMVDLLVERGNRAAAIALEDLWNGMARRFDLSLLCSYRLDRFDADQGGLQRICDAHSRVHGPLGADERLHESEGRMRLLIDSIRDYAIFMLDPTGRVTTWNPGAQRVKGYQAAEIIGRHFSIFYPIEDVRAGKCELELRVAADTGRFEDEGWRVRQDGTRFWANVVISAVRDADQRLVGFAKVTRDLTERRRNEEERAALIAEKQASRAKDEFLAMLGHELRNPLAPIVTALQLMKLRGEVEPSNEQVVIERQVRHMVRLVDDLLDVSRISERKVELKRELFELAAAVVKAVEIASPIIEQRRHRLSIDVPRTGLRLHADPVRLTQVVSNLLTNAARYSELEGSIEVSAWRDGHEVVLQVKDEGVGIGPELLPRVFDLFVQGPRASDRAESGLGIGLTLVRTLVQMHGGSVVALSEGAGRGSAFVVRLPAAPLDAEAAAETAPSRSTPRSLHPKRVLVVDDNQDAAALLSELLETMGHEVRVAHDGLQALAALADFTPEVAVLDIGLPVMDGYELAGCVRRKLGPGCRLIALTGYGQEHDHKRSETAGFHAHLVKPVEASRLLQLIDV